jgi:hypothetical protein
MEILTKMIFLAILLAVMRFIASIITIASMAILSKHYLGGLAKLHNLQNILLKFIFPLGYPQN